MEHLQDYNTRHKLVWEQLVDVEVCNHKDKDKFLIMVWIWDICILDTPLSHHPWQLSEGRSPPQLHKLQAPLRLIQLPPPGAYNNSSSSPIRRHPLEWLPWLLMVRHHTVPISITSQDITTVTRPHQIFTDVVDKQCISHPEGLMYLNRILKPWGVLSIQQTCTVNPPSPASSEMRHMVVGWVCTGDREDIKEEVLEPLEAVEKEEKVQVEAVVHLRYRLLRSTVTAELGTAMVTRIHTLIIPETHRQLQRNSGHIHNKVLVGTSK
mmetsp:Transcript_21623/g.21756  ORF Transcript_21623/g.21756 Transcript_21623/m.21756 type:complete len:266 (-) Transcript_21623:358-1155(-)